MDRLIFRKLNLHNGYLLPNQNKNSADTKISNIVPSVRICRALKKAGIQTIEDLRALKEGDLLKFSDLGDKRINEPKKHLNGTERKDQKIVIDKGILGEAFIS